MGFWVSVMFLANAGAMSIGYAVQQYDRLLGHTVGLALVFLITMLCVDQMARESK